MLIPITRDLYNRNQKVTKVNQYRQPSRDKDSFYLSLFSKRPPSLFIINVLFEPTYKCHGRSHKIGYINEISRYWSYKGKRRTLCAGKFKIKEFISFLETYFITYLVFY